MSINYHAKQGLVFGKGVCVQALTGLLTRAGRKTAAPEGQGIYQESISAKFPIGTKMDTGDRIFRYTKNGAATGVAGKLYESAAKGGAVLGTLEGIAVAANSPAGGSTITVTLPNNGATDSVVVNQFKDGYITIATGTAVADGRGQTFKIASHPAAARNANCVITIYDTLPVEIDESEVTASITANVYDGVIISPAGAMTGTPAGVPLIAVTAAYYAWFQTGGPCGVLLENDTTAGAPLGAANGIAGAVETNAAGASSLLIPTVAHAISDADDAEYALVNLCID